MKVALTFLSLILVACGADNGSQPMFQTIDPKLQPFVDELGCDYSLELTMGFTEVKGHAALCTVYPDGRKEITVDADTWRYRNAAERKILVYHELGHCLMNRTHDESVDGNGEPHSIMNPTTFSRESAAFFLENEESYVEELKAYGGCRAYD